MACEFCEQYENSKKINDDINEQNIIEAELKVALVAEHYRDGYRVGSYTDRPVELIFCPMCGKRLVED